LIEVTNKELRIVSQDQESTIKNVSSIVIHIKNAKNVELRLNVGEEQASTVSGVSQAEQSRTVWRTKPIQEAREKGKKIKLNSATVIVYNGKVYLDGCWPSDYTIVSNALSLNYVMNLIDRVRLTDFERAKSAVQEVLQGSDKVTIRRLARSKCAVNALTELEIKVHRGEVRL